MKIEPDLRRKLMNLGVRRYSCILKIQIFLFYLLESSKIIPCSVEQIDHTFPLSTLRNHRNDVMKCLKLKWNHELRVSGFTAKLSAFHGVIYLICNGIDKKRTVVVVVKLRNLKTWFPRSFSWGHAFVIAEEEIAPFVLRHFHCLSSRRRFRPMSSREVLGWVAQSIVSFNHWLSSIKTNTLSR